MSPLKSLRDIVQSYTYELTTKVSKEGNLDNPNLEGTFPIV